MKIESLLPLVHLAAPFFPQLAPLLPMIDRGAPIADQLIAILSKPDNQAKLAALRPMMKEAAAVVASHIAAGDTGQVAVAKTTKALAGLHDMTDASTARLMERDSAVF